MAFSLMTVNVNGIRAAYKRDMASVLAETAPDVLALQEVRANDKILADLMGEDWEMVNYSCEIKGRAGVAVLVRRSSHVELLADSARFGAPEGGDKVPVDTGRWLEVDVVDGDRTVTVISAYLHSGELGTEKMDQKYAHLKLVTERMAEIVASGKHAVVVGDLNIVRSEKDIKNWKGNHNKSAGVMDEEIAYVDGWMSSGWTDISRQLHGAEQQGPYTWWSWRGKSFDNDAGWRIDYQLATAELAATATSCVVDRADAYEKRFSDHAPLRVHYA
ncbi:putative exodeoxyribonuclease III [Gleimia coleocanis DSM 15436]|uniref:Putative exodeoxyribonuclease III n=1 Tax=Gleimia coleocanis DSM 15436 TaxID=525245 RepID=C0VZL2_9ACTO|nr:exodeoxyribonuclease III [Gleimia coleocanis]EEH64131.1 putative exodeoxyribonuclease III [Gleimia coleocanis DSM 15436]